MATPQQITGMQGVYLVAAELSERGFIVSPTSRGAFGADLLVTDQSCTRAFSVQVKTNKRTFTFWLLNKKSKELKSDTHIYVLINIRKTGNEIEYFIVPSKIIARNKEGEESKFPNISLERVIKYKNRWDIFGNSAGWCHLLFFIKTRKSKLRGCYAQPSVFHGPARLRQGAQFQEVSAVAGRPGC